MPTYTYTALTGKGEEVKGTAEAVDRNHVIADLRDQGLFPTRVREVGARKPANEPTSPFSMSAACTTSRSSSTIPTRSIRS